jgi:3-dehydroquinate synthase
VLEALGLPTWDDGLSRRDAKGILLVLRGLEEFREHLGGELSLTLLRGLGHGVEVREVEEAALLRALDWLRARAGRA